MYQYSNALSLIIRNKIMMTLFQFYHFDMLEVVENGKCILCGWTKVFTKTSIEKMTIRRDIYWTP